MPLRGAPESHMRSPPEQGVGYMDEVDYIPETETDGDAQSAQSSDQDRLYPCGQVSAWRELPRTPFPPDAVGMSAISLRKTSLPLFAFLSTSFLLFLAYSGSERPHKGRFRYPDIPPPGASDDDRLRYSKSQILHYPSFRAS
jgi:hypothetical protein